VLGDSTDGIESAFAGNGIFLVAKLLLQKLNYSTVFVSCLVLRIATVRKRSESENSSHKRCKHSLRGSVGLLNVTIDEGGEIERRSVDLSLGL
jgi:hypothetical protein